DEETPPDMASSSSGLLDTSIATYRRAAFEQRPPVLPHNIWRTHEGCRLCIGLQTTRWHPDRPDFGASSEPIPNTRAIALRQTACSKNRLPRPSSLALESGPGGRQ